MSLASLALFPAQAGKTRTVYRSVGCRFMADVHEPRTGPILVLATGGTIGSVASERGVVLGRAGRDIVPDHPDVGDVDVEDFEPAPSWDFTLDKMWRIARRARRALADGAPGVVVTHGTDTTELTALMCDLVVGEAGPVAMATAMRNGSEVGFEGPRHVLDCIRYLRSSPPHGCVVVSNGEAHAARWVTKTDTMSPATFRSPGHAPVATVNEAGIRFAPYPPPRPAAGDRAADHVAIIPTWGGMGGEIVEFHRAQGVEGLVVEATGAGNVPAQLVEPLASAVADGLPVVVVSRCATGAVGPVYGSPGGGARLADIGVTFGGDLNAAKARVAMAVALGLGGDPVPAVQRFFDELIG